MGIAERTPQSPEPLIFAQELSLGTVTIRALVGLHVPGMDQRKTHGVHRQGGERVARIRRVPCVTAEAEIRHQVPVGSNRQPARPPIGE